MKPIIFNTEIVRAILDGRKTQTRRIIKPQPDTEWLEHIIKRNETNRPYGEFGIMVMVDGKEKKCPYGEPGDRLWIKHPANVFDVYYTPIRGFEGIYSVGTDSIIYRMDKDIPSSLVPSPTSKGYPSVSLSKNGDKKTYLVHRLVCEAFYGEPLEANWQVRHLDGNRENNLLSNLDWGTQEDNWDDRKLHGNGMGEEHHQAKLTSEEVEFIRKSKQSQRQLASRFNVSQPTIWGIKNRITWNNELKSQERNIKEWKLWKSSRYMPQWASRITLEVKDVRVEKLKDLTDDDARAEGVRGFGGMVGANTAMLVTGTSSLEEAELYTLCMNFIELWDGINKKRGYGWDTNPWVWIVEFEKV